MKIIIASWKTRNLRVPDMEVVLKDGLNFIQIPNGGGKTTIQKLIKASITNTLDQFKINSNNPNGLMDLADKNDFQEEGLFELKLKIIESENDIHNDEITFFHKFNFEKDVITTRTSSGARGMVAGWRPPSILLDYMNPEHANVFIFKGDYLEPYFNEDPNKGMPVFESIETFSGIKEIKACIGKINQTFEEANASKSKKSKSTTNNKLKTAQDHHKKLLKKLEESEENYSSFKKIIDDLNAKNKDSAEIKSFREQQRQIEIDISDTSGELLTSESELSLLLSNPLNISNNISDLALRFHNKLEKAKLPGYASEFFIDIANEAEYCICGDKLDKTKREQILKNKDKYLQSNEVDIVNRMKHSINQKSNDINEDEVSNLVQKISTFSKDLIEKKKIHEDLDRKIAKSSLTKDEYDLLQETIKKFTKSEGEVNDLKKDAISLSRLKKLSNENIYELTSINDTKHLIEYYETEAAEAGGYANALKQKNAFVYSVLAALKEAYNDICEEIKNEVNAKISKSHHDKTFKVKSIDQKIHIEGSSEGGSGGQNVITVTAFATTLLERSKANFPLLIDHPVTALQNDSRGEIAKMLFNIDSQVICLVIDTEKSCFVTERDNKTFLPTSEQSNILTITRYDRGVSLGVEVPKDGSTHQSKNGIVTSNKDFFIDFRMETLD